jgi:hypothetical protein
MTQLMQQRIFDALWPPVMPRWSKICAVLDAARDRRIFDGVERCRLEKCCLYAGEIPWALQRAAPYLVVLEREDAFTRWLFESGWGDSWGIFFRSDAPMLDVRRHLRSLLRVKDEAGRKLLFRWYDPRVLRIYLPTCTAEELRMFFGPVEWFAAESEDAVRLARWQIVGEELHQGAVELGEGR